MRRPLSAAKGCRSGTVPPCVRRPLSIAKGCQSNTLGYTAGIAKVYLVDGFQGFLLIPYAINFILVGTETALYFRNTRLDRQSERESGTRDRDGA